MPACPRCGSPIAVPSHAGVPPQLTCPACGARFAVSARLAGQAPAAPVREPIEAEVERARADPRHVFGRFVLLGELGRGGMGVVHRAWDVGLRRVVALKTLLADDADRDAVKRFHREGEAVARLRHPGIVPVLEVGEHEGRHYLVMDFVEGTTLEKRIDPKRAAGRARLGLEDRVAIVRDVARAVQYAHERGVIHRDLKPQNVIVDANDRPLVLDFGLARIRGTRSRLTRTGASMGTPAYMPPEQAGPTAEEQPDERSDVYSLGATLYHAITGRPPFEGATEFNVISAVLTKDPLAPGKIAAEAQGDLDAVCLRCLEKEPARRYQTAGELADELERYLAGEETEARPRTSVEEALRAVQRHTIAIGVSALVLAVAIGGSIALARASSRAKELEEKQRQLEAEIAARDTAPPPAPAPSPTAVAAPAPTPTPSAVASTVPPAPTAPSPTTPSVSPPAPATPAPDSRPTPPQPVPTPEPRVATRVIEVTLADPKPPERTRSDWISLHARAPGATACTLNVTSPAGTTTHEASVKDGIVGFPRVDLRGPDGTYELRLDVTDGGNGEGSLRLPIVVRRTPPVVKVEAPPGPLDADETKATVTFSGEDVALLRVNGAELTKSKPTGPWTYDVRVDRGKSAKVRWVAKDALGNSTREEVVEVRRSMFRTALPWDLDFAKDFTHSMGRQRSEDAGWVCVWDKEKAGEIGQFSTDLLKPGKYIARFELLLADTFEDKDQKVVLLDVKGAISKPLLVSRNNDRFKGNLPDAEHPKGQHRWADGFDVDFELRNPSNVTLVAHWKDGGVGGVALRKVTILARP